MFHISIITDQYDYFVVAVQADAMSSVYVLFSFDVHV